MFIHMPYAEQSENNIDMVNVRKFCILNIVKIQPLSIHEKTCGICEIQFNTFTRKLSIGSLTFPGGNESN